MPKFGLFFVPQTAASCGIFACVLQHTPFLELAVLTGLALCSLISTVASEACKRGDSSCLVEKQNQHDVMQEARDSAVRVKCAVHDATQGSLASTGGVRCVCVCVCGALT